LLLIPLPFFPFRSSAALFTILSSFRASQLTLLGSKSGRLKALSNQSPKNPLPEFGTNGIMCGAKV
jgi:hypothetical protein